MLVLLKLCKPEKREKGHTHALALIVEDRTFFILPSLLLLFIYISILLSSATSFLCCLQVCQAFIKQLEEGVSFCLVIVPALSHQSSPLEEPADTPLSRPGAEPGAGLGYSLYICGWGSLWSSALAQ